jgi:hypothetical protein
MKKIVFLLFFGILIIAFICMAGCSPDDSGGNGADGDAFTGSTLFFIEGYASQPDVIYINLSGFSRLDESEVMFPMLRAGTIKSFTFKATNNTAEVDCIVTLRKNGTDTDISITIPAGTTGVYTDADTVSFLASDELSIETDLSGPSEFIGVEYNIGLEYEYE